MTEFIEWVRIFKEKLVTSLPSFMNINEKEFVRKQGKALQGTQFHVYEQFPKEVGDKRRTLVPRMQAARRDGKRAWISYDTLYIDGKAVRD